MKEKIDIYVFKKSRICRNPKHHIDFKDDSDIYNPFGMRNLALSSSFDICECSDLIDLAYEFAIMHDYSISSFNWLELQFLKAMTAPLSGFIHSNVKDLKSFRVPLDCACMKVVIDFGLSHERMNILFHALTEGPAHNVFCMMIVDAFMK